MRYLIPVFIFSISWHLHRISCHRLILANRNAQQFIACYSQSSSRFIVYYCNFPSFCRYIITSANCYVIVPITFRWMYLFTLDFIALKYKYVYVFLETLSFVLVFMYTDYYCIQILESVNIFRDRFVGMHLISLYPCWVRAFLTETSSVALKICQNFLAVSA